MAILGNQPSFVNFPKFSDTGDGVETTYTLTWAPASASSIIVTIQGVVQTPDVDYVVQGNDLIFTIPVANGDAFFVRSLGLPASSIVPIDGSVGPNKLAANALDNFVGVDPTDVPTVGDILGKHIVCIPAGAMKPRLTAGAVSATIALATNGTLVTSLNFDPNSEQFAQFSHTAPDSLDSSANLLCSFKWSHPVTTVNFGVSWAVRAKFVGNDDALDGAWSDWVQVNGVGGTTDDSYNTGGASIMPAGTYADGCKIYWEVKRVAGDVINDTLAVVARLDEFSFKYTTNALNDN